MKDENAMDPSAVDETHDGGVEVQSDGAPSTPTPEGPSIHATTPEEVEEAFAQADQVGELESLQSELEELNDRHVRLAAEFNNYRRRAEFNNYRRRAERDSLATWGRAQADLVRRFLDVLDDLTRVSGLDPAEESVTVQSIVEGIDLVERKFLRALEESGTELVIPGPGDVFDPETMEAMMRVPADDPALDDQVAQLFQKGYKVDGNLVRAARVSVYKAD